MKTKRNLIIASTVILAAMVFVGTTLAYFWDEASVTNEFTTAAGVDIDVDEPNWNREDGEDITPGDVISKDPTLSNLQDDVYARMVMAIVDKDTGEVITDQDRLDKIYSMLFYSEDVLQPDGSITLPEPMTADELAVLPRINPLFVLDDGRTGEGVYYFNYDGVLTKDDEGIALFTGLVVPTNWTGTDMTEIGNFDLVIKGQAIQTANIDSAEAAYTALDTEIENAPVEP
ncbi:hypothetical protein LJC61_06095 [Ruminococcaceae bacterium OttesenSCG-928-A16]|nr:hypothetical protein [Ruminococcaceae bacterium OttesenSCG-928-A16]